jgi:serine/threonine protein kinase
VKPENILLDPETGILKLGDLGSAKQGPILRVSVSAENANINPLFLGRIYITKMKTQPSEEYGINFNKF